MEPENAAILAGGTVGTHLQMGIGDGVIPAILNQEIYDDICIVTDNGLRIRVRIQLNLVPIVRRLADYISDFGVRFRQEEPGSAP